MKFNSQICTDKVQSERLLALGLKKETADMVWTHAYYGTWVATAKENPLYEESDSVPAWSLHRLIEMALRYILICGISFTFNEDAYEKVIGIIEHQIKEGDFNKEYLVNQAEIEEHCKGVLEYLDYIKGEEE